MRRQSKPTIGPVDFIDRVIKVDEKGEPFRLAQYQRRVLEMALRRDPSGELVFRLVVPKKSGKTFMAACFQKPGFMQTPVFKGILNFHQLHVVWLRLLDGYDHV